MAEHQTGANNGRLWGMRARDWAEVQEATARPGFEAGLDLAGVAAGTRYLDMGCGAGMAAQIAADRGAKVSGVDAAAALLVIARERVPGGDFRIADLEALPFEDASFDAVTGFNAFQYAGNPLAALAEARRVTKPDGNIVIMVWGDPARMEMSTVITALGPLLPPPPPGARGPFALSDEDALHALAEEAGLQPVRMIKIDTAIIYPDLKTALRGLNSSGVASRAIENAGEDAVSRAHTIALAPFRRAGGDYDITASFRCLLAKPDRTD
jgi:SAM-dependent methyltransferase